MFDNCHDLPPVGADTCLISRESLRSLAHRLALGDVSERLKMALQLLEDLEALNRDRDYLCHGVLSPVPEIPFEYGDHVFDTQGRCVHCRGLYTPEMESSCLYA